MMLIEQFQDLNQPEHLIMTQHCRKRLAERGIQLMDIMDTIRTGEIIEDYPEDNSVSKLFDTGLCRRAGAPRMRRYR